jgi:hypothetical protein
VIAHAGAGHDEAPPLGGAVTRDSRRGSAPSIAVRPSPLGGHVVAVKVGRAGTRSQWRQNRAVSVGEELIEERRRRRRAGDPRLSPEGRELFRRMTTGDLMDEFQAGLDAVSAADPLIGGGTDDD